jgi:hypothetical protein
MDYSRAVMIACFASTLAACGASTPGARHAVPPKGTVIQLVFEDSTMTNEYVCGVSTEKKECTPKGSPTVADYQLSGTKHIFVASQCGGKFWRIQIEQVQSARPIARVVCAQ